MNGHPEPDDRSASEVPLRELLREDLATHDGSLMHPGFHAIAAHRLLVRAQGSNVLLRAATKWLNFLLIRNVYGTEIDRLTDLGRRVKIGHHQGVVIGAGVVIGDDCLIRQGLTLGLPNDEAPGDQVPVIGNRVHFGARSIVAGRVRVGDDARIGPGAIVTRNIPAGATVFAQPARIIKATAPEA